MFFVDEKSPAVGIGKLDYVVVRIVACSNEKSEVDVSALEVQSHSRYFGETAFKMLKGDNKELVIVPGASHCDLYDGGGKNAIPFDFRQSVRECISMIQ